MGSLDAFDLAYTAGKRDVHNVVCYGGTTLRETILKVYPSKCNILRL